MSIFGRPSQSLKLAYAKRDINQSIVVTGGSTLGAGIWQWSEWQSRVESGAEGAAASATRVALGDSFVDREICRYAADHARRFLQGKSNRRSITLVGNHGTGRSVVAMSVAHTLAKEGYEEIYIVDDYLRFSQTDLRHVLPSSKRTVIIIDDAEIQSANRPMLNASGSLDTCGLAVFANRRSAKAFAALDRNFELLEIPNRPTEGELALLRDKVQKQHIGRRQSSRLQWANIRTACRVLSGEPPTEELAQRLVDLRLDAGPLGQVVSILSTCGARGIELPLTLLVRTIDQPNLSEEIYPWLQSRPVFVHGGEAKTVWIEDRDVLQLAEAIWRAEYTLGDSQLFNEQIHQDFSRLIGAARAKDIRDRLVIRQAIRGLPQRTALKVADTAMHKLVESISEEVDTASVLRWMSSLSALSSQFPLLRGAIMNRLNETEPDLATLLSFVTDSSLTHGLDTEEHRQIASIGDIELWASVVEVLDGPRGQFLGIPVIQTVIECLRLHPTGGSILSIRNSAQILARLGTKHGRPQQRIWLRDAFLSDLKVTGRIGNMLLDLAKRCVTQGRFRIALDGRWNPPTARGYELDDLRTQYDMLYSERGRDRVEEVAHQVFDAIMMSVGVERGRDQSWYQLVEFVDYYDRKRLVEVSVAAISDVLRIWELRGLRYCHTAAAKLFQTNFRSNAFTSEDLTRALQLLGQTGSTPVRISTLNIQILDALACLGDNLVEPALAGLRAYSLPEPELRRAGLQPALDQIYSLLGLADRAVLTIETCKVDKFASSALIHSMTHHYPKLPLDTINQTLENLTSQYAGCERVNGRLLSLCLAAGRPDLALSVMPADWETDSNWRLRAARIQIAQGDVGAGRNLVMKDRTATARVTHALPLLASQAYYDLGMAVGDIEGEMWLLLAALTMPGALAPSKQVLAALIAGA